MSKLKTVLLVDDSTVIFLNKMLLTRLQVADHLQVATNGQEALDALDHLCASI